MVQVTPSVSAGDPTGDGLVSAWVSRAPDGKLQVGVNASLATGVTAKIDVAEWRRICAGVDKGIAEAENGRAG